VNSLIIHGLSRHYCLLAWQRITINIRIPYNQPMWLTSPYVHTQHGCLYKYTKWYLLTPDVLRFAIYDNFTISFQLYAVGLFAYISARNNSWPLAIFQPISTFGRPKSILVGQFYCTISIGWQSITYKMSYFQKNSRPISDPYFYHCTYVYM